MFFIKNINEKELAEQSGIVDYFNSGKCNYIIDEVAAEKGMIGQAETKKLQEWRKDPANWTPNTDRNAD